MRLAPPTPSFSRAVLIPISEWLRVLSHTFPSGESTACSANHLLPMRTAQSLIREALSMIGTDDGPEAFRGSKVRHPQHAFEAVFSRGDGRSTAQHSRLISVSAAQDADRERRSRLCEEAEHNCEEDAGFRHIAAKRICSQTRATYQNSSMC